MVWVVLWLYDCTLFRDLRARAYHHARARGILHLAAPHFWIYTYLKSKTSHCCGWPWCVLHSWQQDVFLELSPFQLPSDYQFSNPMQLRARNGVGLRNWSYLMYWWAHMKSTAERHVGFIPAWDINHDAWGMSAAGRLWRVAQNKPAAKHGIARCRSDTSCYTYKMQPLRYFMHSFLFTKEVLISSL